MLEKIDRFDALASGIILGLVLGFVWVLVEVSALKREAIDHGAARFWCHPVTGEKYFKWKDELPAGTIFEPVLPPGKSHRESPRKTEGAP